MIWGNGFGRCVWPISEITTELFIFHFLFCSGYVINGTASFLGQKFGWGFRPNWDCALKYDRTIIEERYSVIWHLAREDVLKINTQENREKNDFLKRVIFRKCRTHTFRFEEPQSRRFSRSIRGLGEECLRCRRKFEIYYKFRIKNVTF